ncbi:hypothetical protein L4D77_25320 [Photobacterium frigidiphilum]|uniref:hypothetical protein n=1 Tax=Photobacterium frigidiphilum TaxID=264736 RepID=UPI003D150D71
MKYRDRGHKLFTVLLYVCPFFAFISIKLNLDYFIMPSIVGFCMSALVLACEKPEQQLGKGLILIFGGIFINLALGFFEGLINPDIQSSFLTGFDFMKQAFPIAFFGAGGSVIGAHALKSSLDNEPSSGVVVFDKNYKLKELEKNIDSLQEKLNVLIVAIMLLSLILIISIVINFIK